MTDKTSSTVKENTMAIQDLVIDTASHEVRLGQSDINLTLIEFNLLLMLARKRGQVVRRAELIQEIWGSRELMSDRTINVHVCRLRKKIEAHPKYPSRIVLVRDVGYKLSN